MINNFVPAALLAVHIVARKLSRLLDSVEKNPGFLLPSVRNAWTALYSVKYTFTLYSSSEVEEEATVYKSRTKRGWLQINNTSIGKENYLTLF